MNDREGLLDSIMPGIYKMAAELEAKGLVGADKAVEKDDLVQAGMLAAWQASERFNPAFEVKFLTYAYPFLYRAMETEIRNMGGSVAIPQKFMQYVITNVADTIAELAQKFGEKPTVDELLENEKLSQKIRASDAYSNIGSEYLEAHIKSAYEYLEGGQDISFDTIGDEDDGLEEYLEDTSEEISPEFMYMRAEMEDEILAALELLPHKERATLEHRFGMVDGKQWSLRELGKKFGVSQETVRKWERRGMENLRRIPQRFGLEGWLE